MTEYPDIPGFAYADGGVVAPLGFLASGVSAGLKSEGKRDLALVVAEKPFPPPPSSPRTRSQLRRLSSRGATSRAAWPARSSSTPATRMRARARRASATRSPWQTPSRPRSTCAPDEVIVSSTGVIGVPLPVDKVVARDSGGRRDARQPLGDEAAAAIMTTDTFAKQTALSLEIDGRRVTVGGMAKGSGMIAPNMATMLAVITTDAPLTSGACDAALRHAVAFTFNRVTVDMDTSTNDMCVLLASGAAGGDEIDRRDPAFELVQEADSRGRRRARADDRARRRGCHQARHGHGRRRRLRRRRREGRVRDRELTAGQDRAVRQRRELGSGRRRARPLGRRARSGRVRHRLRRHRGVPRRRGGRFRRGRGARGAQAARGRDRVNLHLGEGTPPCGRAI